MRARLIRLRMPALQAVLVFVIWATTIAVGLQLGWYPLNVGNYVAVGVIASLAILVCREFPLAGLLVIGFITIFPAWFFDEPEIRMIPLVLAAYFASSRGLNLFVAGGLTAVFTFFTMIPVLTYGWLGVPPADIFSYYALRDPSTRVLATVVVFTAVVVGNFAHRQAATTAKLHERNEELQALRNSEIERIASQERTRIARDIHDVVAHHVSAMVINAQAADHVADTQPEKLRPAVRSVIANGQEALTAMRRAVKVLRADDPQAYGTAAVPFASALDQIVARVRDTGLTVSTTLAPEVRLRPDAESAVLQITQEALTNVMIHSNASEVKITLARYADSVELTVCDNGSADLGDSIVGRRLLGVGAGGSGIQGMRERAEALDGTLASERIDHGWRTSALMPIASVAESVS